MDREEVKLLSKKLGKKISKKALDEAMLEMDGAFSARFQHVSLMFLTFSARFLSQRTGVAM